MKIIKEAIAGTLESSDLLVKISPQDKLEVIIHSNVMQQFGDKIKAAVMETLKKLQVTDGLIIIEDKGALDCAIKARVQIAILRAAEVTELNWSLLK